MAARLSHNPPMGIASRQYWIFQGLFWAVAAFALVQAESMSIPMEFAITRGLFHAGFGALASLVMLQALGESARRKPSTLIGLSAFLSVVLGLAAAVTGNLASFLYLDFDLGNILWSYYFQGAFRLVLILALWSALFGFFSHALRTAGKQGNNSNAVDPADNGEASDALSTPGYMAIEKGGKVIPVPTASIYAFRSADDYVEVHTSDGTFLHKGALKALERRLDREVFLRIHRTAIINLHHIRELEPRTKGDYVVILKSGERLRASRRYRDQLRARIAGTI